VTAFAKKMKRRYGRPFVGPAMIDAFLDWISPLQCGLDLLDQDDY
jgi:hypothetical protein